jgi:hypothetical protein
MIYTTYDPATGKIQGTVTSSEPGLPESTSTVGVIEGSYDARTNRVVNGQVEPLPGNPSNPSLYYEFDYIAGVWKLNTELSQILSRITRNKMLEDIDRINPIWYASLNTDQQQQLIEYRQALLAVPQQSGFPETVTWPVKPTWLS